jgi:hypothetical protein
VGRRNRGHRGPLPSVEVRCDEVRLTRFSGLFPLVQFAVKELDITAAMRSVVGGGAGRRRRHAPHLVMLAFVWAALGGFHRLSHVEALRGDPLLLRLSRLGQWPVRKVFSQALSGLTDAALERLTALISALGMRALGSAPRAIVDIDSTPLVCFGVQEGAKFGYCGKLGRNRRRHAPIVASLASARTVVDAEYCDGGGRTAADDITFVERVRQRIWAQRPGLPVWLRGDSGFWSKALGTWLLEQAVPFAIALPLLAGIKPALLTTEFRPVDDFDEDVHIGVLPGARLGFDERLRVVVVRRFVHDASAPPPGKVIAAAPNCRFQAIITDLDWRPEDIWRFYNDRGDCERVFKVTRQALGLNCLAGHSFRANQAAFLLRMLAFNIDMLFEQRAAAKCKGVTGLIRRQHAFYNAPAKLVLAHGRLVFRAQATPMTRALWRTYAPELVSTA